MDHRDFEAMALEAATHKARLFVDSSKRRLVLARDIASRSKPRFVADNSRREVRFETVKTRIKAACQAEA
jgi:hypothetical protein